MRACLRIGHERGAGLGLRRAPIEAASLRNGKIASWRCSMLAPLTPKTWRTPSVENPERAHPRGSW
jgi:hypothetical protein